MILGLFVIPNISDARFRGEGLFYYFPNEKGLQSIKQNYRDIDILAPQIYEVGVRKELIKLPDGGVLEFADDKNIDVMPLVINAAFNKSLMTQILEDESAQEEIIDDLVRDARKYGYIGYQFDFENIDHFDRELYVDFVERAAKEFKRKRLAFSVAVIPSTVPYDRDGAYQDWSSGYDIEAIAKHADFISLMSYDDPRSVGPVSSVKYLDKVLNETLEKVEPEKISLGIPFYCWQYELGNPKKIADVTYAVSANILDKYKDTLAISTYSKEHEAEIFLFLKDTLNIIWCDNEQSFEAKLGIINDNKLHGFSAWALGQEDNRIWRHL